MTAWSFGAMLDYDAELFGPPCFLAKEKSAGDKTRKICIFPTEFLERQSDKHLYLSKRISSRTRVRANLHNRLCVPYMNLCTSVVFYALGEDG